MGGLFGLDGSFGSHRLELHNTLCSPFLLSTALLVPLPGPSHTPALTNATEGGGGGCPAHIPTQSLSHSSPGLNPRRCSKPNQKFQKFSVADRMYLVSHSGGCQDMGTRMPRHFGR